MDEQNVKERVTDVGGIDKGYLLNFEAEKVCLTVYPYSDEKILFELTDITKTLEEHGITEYELDLIAKTVRDGSGEPVQIVNPKQEQEEEAETIELVDPIIKINVSKNRMEAILSFETTEHSRLLVESMIRDKLVEAGITYGIKEESIERILNRRENDVCIALGTPPQNGVNATIVRHFDAEKCGRPEEIEHGRVDFKNLNLFILVKKGDLLAERFPATQGTPGTDVFGGTVAAKPGKPIMLPVGKNTKIVEDHKIIADMDGQVVLHNNKITVDPRIEIKGDVDLSTGNIEFNGSVTIKGSVQAGFFVKAEGDVDINGNISGGTVEARNITVRAGIQGMQRGHIIAQEDIRSSFAENAKIVAGRDLFISEAILHSDVSAGKRIICEGKRGIVAGGSAVAGAEIRVKSAGNQMDTSTKLEVGVNPMLREEYQRLKKDFVKAQDELDQAQKALVLLKNIPKEQLTPVKHDLLLRLTKAQFPLAGTVKKYKDRLAEIEAELLTLKEGKIRISEFVYPGVKIIVGSIIKNIRSKEQHCLFYAEQGEIKRGIF